MSGANLPPLKMRKLGRANVRVTELGLGTAPLGELFDRIDDNDAAGLIAAAWSGGVRYFDTSPWYGRGLAEHTLGRALYRKPRGDYVISTKIGRVLRRPLGPNAINDQWLGGLEFQTVFNYGYDGVMRSFEDSLQRLGINRVDVLLIHDLDPWDHNSAALNAYLTQLKTSGWRALVELREAGVIGGIGAGFNSLGSIPRYLDLFDIDFFLLAMRYTLLEQDVLESEFPRCAERGVGIIVGGGYNSGILATGAVPGAMYNYEPAGPAILERVGKIERVCARHGVPLPAAALQFPLGHPIVASIIPGAIARAQVEQNLAAFRHPIPPDLWAELKHEKLIRADAPVRPERRRKSEETVMFACAPDDERAPQAIGCLCHTPAFARLNRRLTEKFSCPALGAGAFAAGLGTVSAGSPARMAPIVFTNVRVFDGKSDALKSGLEVVVEGNRIKSVAPGAGAGVDGETIDCVGRVLMPGLIDAHWHAMMAAAPLDVLMTADVGYINLIAADEARRTLMRGFTSVRDMAGPTFALKRAIDDRIVAGPRIWPSGAMISQSGGHGDFRLPYEVPAAPNGPLSRGDAMGAGAVADGADRVLTRAREQLMLGASQLKLAAGGGVASNYDPIDVSQYTEAEFRAAVDAAENWGTYVAVHAYTPRAIRTAIRGGVRCIEHGHLMDEATAQLIADNDIWLSTQAFLDNEFSNRMPTPEGEAKARQVYAGTDAAYRFARQYKLKTAWGTDLLFDPGMTANQGAILTTLRQWHSPPEILRMATSVNGELLAMSGPRNPYPGKLGVVEEGALADLILVDGDPIEDLKLIADPETNFFVIMKDGRFVKNAL